MEGLIPIIAVCIIGPLIGSLLGVLKTPSDALTRRMLSFAAGVMLAISFLGLIPESIELSSSWICMAGVILGAAIMILVDKAIPHLHPSACDPKENKALRKAALYLFIGIFIHNFPEGIAMGIVSPSNFRLSLSIALAIAIHDIPESLCTAMPYYKLTGSRAKAFLISASTIIPTIIGLVLAHYFSQFLPLYFVGLLIGVAAGLMIYISSDELIPASCCGAEDKSSILSLIAGVILVIMLGAL